MKETTFEFIEDFAKACVEACKTNDEYADTVYLSNKSGLYRAKALSKEHVEGYIEEHYGDKPFSTVNIQHPKGAMFRASHHLKNGSDIVVCDSINPNKSVVVVKQDRTPA